MRRSLSIFKALGVASVVALYATSLIPSLRAADGPLAPINLKCEYLTNPVGIDVRLPRFGWIDRLLSGLPSGLFGPFHLSSFCGS